MVGYVLVRRGVRVTMLDCQWLEAMGGNQGVGIPDTWEGKIWNWRW